MILTAIENPIILLMKSFLTIVTGLTVTTTHAQIARFEGTNDLYSNWSETIPECVKEGTENRVHCGYRRGETQVCLENEVCMFGASCVPIHKHMYCNAHEDNYCGNDKFFHPTSSCHCISNESYHKLFCNEHRHNTPTFDKSKK